MPKEKASEADAKKRAKSQERKKVKKDTESDEEETKKPQKKKAKKNKLGPKKPVGAYLRYQIEYMAEHVPKGTPVVERGKYAKEAKAEWDKLSEDD